MRNSVNSTQYLANVIMSEAIAHIDPKILIMPLFC